MSNKKSMFIKVETHERLEDLSLKMKRKGINIRSFGDVIDELVKEYMKDK